MFSIILDNKDITNKITEWIYKLNNDTITVTYLSGKKYSAELSRYQVMPTIDKSNVIMLLDKKRNKKYLVENVIELGNKYVLFTYTDSKKKGCYLRGNIDLIEGENLNNNNIFKYLKEVIDYRVAFPEGKNDRNKEIAKKINEFIQYQMGKLTCTNETVLYSYLSKSLTKRETDKSLVFPFGINASQLTAVEKVFNSQISIIEGPPGTGKTQTILNIIANIILQNKTVAVVSNNDSAVTNIYEKMEKVNMDYLLAKLGKTEKISEFFKMLPEIPEIKKNDSVKLVDVQETLENLKESLQEKNDLAKQRNLLAELKIEQEYFIKWMNDYREAYGEVTDVPDLKLHSEKKLNFISFLKEIQTEKFSFIDRVTLLFKFKLLKIKPLQNSYTREEIITIIQEQFYQEEIAKTEKAILQLEDRLAQKQFESLLEKLSNDSLIYYQQEIVKIVGTTNECSEQNYKQNFTGFSQRFPIIGSTAHSIAHAIGGNVVDYLIIDEASQLDIIPGILGLACARNMVVVGDRKQLPHIPAKTNLKPAEEFYDCEKYNLLDSCIQLFKDEVPITLLQEHYRCHPKIIHFCNIQFYNNQLITMTESDDERSLRLITTAKGNHFRDYFNVREVESVLAEGLGESDSIGFISPYNAQCNEAEKRLPKTCQVATIHSFQGRECDEIIFSTVLDKKARCQSKSHIDFVDDPHLVNVAVSRAKEKFSLVTGQGIFRNNNGSLAALERYIRYYGDERDIIESDVISSFDLLYAEYDKTLEKRRKKIVGNDSRYRTEQIIASIVKEILEEKEFNQLEVHQQVRLKEVVSPSLDYTEEEKKFIQKNSSCDFVFSYRVGKDPIAVIEVDGYAYHTRPKDKSRDRKKNNILEKAGIDLLRLSTIESAEELRIRSYLRKYVASKHTETV
ncbi:AAA domain-containing protein [uncultured Vagococcus sp.]|uniref:AAA domain-containing protein n=1 Tax=uncultured Vagococcus sp. TaxID=189676 RepID=UPI0028D0AAAB|nr:AAA domain-containing protein [uncultured Vagococcus sp.]